MRRDFKHGMCCRTEEKKSTEAQVRKKMIILWDVWTWRKLTSYLLRKHNAPTKPSFASLGRVT